MNKAGIIQQAIPFWRLAMALIKFLTLALICLFAGITIEIEKKMLTRWCKNTFK